MSVDEPYAIRPGRQRRREFMAAMRAKAARIFLQALNESRFCWMNACSVPHAPSRALSRDLWARIIMDALNPQSGLRPSIDPVQGLDRRAHRNLLLLAGCQAVGQS